MRFKKLEKYDYIKTKKEALEQLEYLRQEHNYMLERLDKCISKTEKAVDWTIKYQTEWCQEDEVIRDLSNLLEILNGGNDENN